MTLIRLSTGRHVIVGTYSSIGHRIIPAVMNGVTVPAGHIDRQRSLSVIRLSGGEGRFGIVRRPTSNHVSGDVTLDTAGEVRTSATATPAARVGQLGEHEPKV